MRPAGAKSSDRIVAIRVSSAGRNDRLQALRTGHSLVRAERQQRVDSANSARTKAVVYGWFADTELRVSGLGGTAAIEVIACGMSGLDRRSQDDRRSRVTQISL